jgi:hypothetical protein
MVLSKGNLISFLPATRDEIDLAFKIKVKNPITENYEYNYLLLDRFNTLIKALIDKQTVRFKYGLYDIIPEIKVS